MSDQNTFESCAFVFPGQGSQTVGMLQAISQHYPAVIETFNEASAVLGYDLWALVSTGPSETLNQTEKTQPALLAASVALWRLWLSLGGKKPAMMAGHSLGEYSALVCAGALSFTDGIRLVAARGHAMQAAVQPGEGAMAAILGMDYPTLQEVCATAAQGEVVSCVNLNAPGQIVIAGNTTAVERAMVLAKEQGAKRALLLPVSVPSHCALMMPAAAAFAPQLAQVTFTAPQIPVIHNVDVAVQNDPQRIRECLVAQLSSPVRWIETGVSMANQGIQTVIECGPGKVLSGLIKRIDDRLQPISLETPDDFKNALHLCEAQTV